MNIAKRIKQILTAKTISITDRLLSDQDKLNLARDEIKSKYEKLAYVLGKTLSGKESISASLRDCETRKAQYTKIVRDLRDKPESKEDALYNFQLYKEYEQLAIQLEKQSNEFDKKIEVLKDKAKKLNILEKRVLAKIDILEVRLAAAKNNTSFTFDGSDDTSSLIKDVEVSVRNMECMKEAEEIVSSSRNDEVDKPIIDEDEMMKL
jgi:predicted  nucleic acid-binding Zn-ribbon protein